MTATKIQPGDDTHLTLLMAPHSLNFVTGADRAALLAYGRDVFAAARDSKCLAQIEEPAGAAPAAVAPQGEYPHEQMDAMALARYKVVPSHASMLWSHAVVAGDGVQQLYVGREAECQNMARKFAGAFLDGAFAFHSMAAAPTTQAAPALEAPAAPESAPWCPDVCPITGRPFFMWIDHWQTGKPVPTYGGPYDSYTIPVKDSDGSFECERYDHDEGGWLTEGAGWHCLGVRLVDDQSFVVDPSNPRYHEIEAFAAAAPQAQASAPDWWRGRADEIEVQVAATGNSEAMRCYTDMRTLLQAAAPALEAPAAPAGDEEAAFTKWFQGEQGKPYQGMWEFARAAWMARAAAPQAPAAPWAMPVMQVHPLETAPKDGTIVQLLVQFVDHPPGQKSVLNGAGPLYDTADPCWTIGGNTVENTGVDHWQFVGWNWEQDCFVDTSTDAGHRVLGWAPFDVAAPAAPVGLPWRAIADGIPAWTDDAGIRVIAVTADDDFGGVQVHDIRASDFHTDGDGDGAEVARVCTHWAYRDEIWPRSTLAAPAAPAVDALSQAARDVLAERRRQVEVEGWTPEHDDQHDEGEMCFAAAGYAAVASDNLQAISRDIDRDLTLDDNVYPPTNYPWPRSWEFKPCTPRRALVKSGALILAEIERIDRCSPDAAQAAAKGAGDE
ncbi:hypothetical protein [Delftia acidovorans]|uniref:hypothetical protein n=1 Tax=Delftia acidovorans TaxID=80866 RepID=UPI002FDEBF8F